MLLAIQGVGIIFGLGMLYITFLHSKKKELTNKEQVTWIGVWLGLIFFSIFPTVIKPLTIYLQMARPLDFFIITGFLFFVAVIYMTYMSVKSIGPKMKQLVTEMAILKKDMEDVRKSFVNEDPIIDKEDCD